MVNQRFCSRFVFCSKNKSGGWADSLVVREKGKDRFQRLLKGEPVRFRDRLQRDLVGGCRVIFLFTADSSGFPGERSFLREKYLFTF